MVTTPHIDTALINSACLSVCRDLFNTYSNEICEANHLTRYNLEEISDQHNLIDRMYMIVQCGDTYDIII